MDGSGGNLQQVTFDDDARVYTPAFSPDGEQIAFRHVKDGRQSIMIVSTKGGEPKELIGSDEDRLSEPAWFPDGSKIVYRAGNSQESELRVVSVSGRSEPVRLPVNLAGTGYIGQPRWSPDGTRIVFTAGVYVQEFWVMDNFLPDDQASSSTSPNEP